MARFKETLASRGVSEDAITDPACYGTPQQKLWQRIKSLFFNIGIALGWA